MKLLSIIFLTLFLGKGCDNEKQADMESAVLEYTANTRGFYEKITISNRKVMVSSDRNGNDSPAAVAISDKDWNELVANFEQTNLEQIPTLKAPTEKRFYDGAAIAKLKIEYKGQIYESTDFDHGFPPAGIEKLVNKINQFTNRK